MTSITILNKDNVPTGPFTREQVDQKLKAGECSLNDLAFVEGLTAWTSLGQILAKANVVTTPPVPLTYAPATVPVAGVPAYSYAATMQPPGHLVYAGFWLRFVAYFIDWLILSIPLMIVGIPIFLAVGGVAAISGMVPQSGQVYNGNPPASPVVPVVIIFFELVLIIGGIVIGWLYYAFLESGPHQSTFGKRALSLKVTNMAGDRITFGHASGRFFSKIITGLIPFAIGYMMAGFTERKQALHDMIAGTLVTRK